MKLSLLLTTLLLSLSSYAFQDGTYTCGSREEFIEITYILKSLTVDGTDLPHLNITKNIYKKPTDPTSKDRSYQISGIATTFIDNKGQETLVLGNFTLDLTNGKIACKN